MSQISQEKRNQIAYDLLVILAMNRRPDTDFLNIFSLAKRPGQNKKLKEEFLSKHSFEDMKTFTEGLFRDGFEKNIQAFSNDFDQETTQYLEDQKQKSE